MKQSLFFFVFVLVGQLVQATNVVPPNPAAMGDRSSQQLKQPKEPQSWRQNCKEIYDCCCCTCKECVIPCVSYTCCECAVPCAKETGRLCWEYKRPLAVYAAFSCICSTIGTLCMPTPHG